MSSPRSSSAPTNRAVMGGMITLALLGLATVFGESALAWLSPSGVNDNATVSNGTPLQAAPTDGGSAVGRDG